ncbi:MAG: hypothetical protein HGA67_01240 [Candidatus Yonathbacteria bacterium]|nr:hypothetical protein [Candidatus Yonathbacteria bacterium]
MNPRLRSTSVKFLSAILLIAMFASIPSPAQAQLAVYVTGDIRRDLTLLPKDMTLDGIAWIVAKALIGNILGDMQEFSNEGFFGDPLIVTNPAQFFARLARAETTVLMGDITDSDIYDPIKRTLLQELAQSYIPYQEKTESDIEDVLEDPELFGQDFVQGGGWTAFFAFLEPQNNLIDQSYLASDEHKNRVQSSGAIVENELNQGEGLLSLPGTCIRFAVGVDVNGDGVTDQADANASCTEWERLTPGQFITSTLSEALGSPVRSLENADEIQEVLSTVINNLVNSLLTQGIAMITASGTEGGTNIQLATMEDARLAEIVNGELSPSNRLVTLRNDVTNTQTEVTQSITAIDTAIASQAFTANDYVPQLQTLRAQLVTQQEVLGRNMTSINTTGVTAAYVTSMNTLANTADSPMSTQQIIDGYQTYSTLTQGVDTFARTDVLNQEGTIRTNISNTNATLNQVQTILDQMEQDPMTLLRR